MLALCGIIGCVMIAIVSVSRDRSEALAGSLCIGMFGLIPLVILIASRLKSRGPKRRTDMIKGQSVLPAGHVSVEIIAGEPMPRICVCCGDDTRRVSTFEYKANYTDSNRYDWSRVHPLLMLLLFWKFAAQMIVTKMITIYERFRDRRHAQKDRMEFRIPHCRRCVRQSPIVQRSFDFHGRKMMIAAPSEFARILSEMRKITRPVR